MVHHVVVLGGGFAGLSAARTLTREVRRNRVRVTVIDRQAESTYLPMLPDLISGRIRDRTVAQPLQPLLRGCLADFHQAEVREIDGEAGTVLTDAGQLQADVILLCTGCETNYFGQVRAPQATVGLKTVAEGRAIRLRADAAIDRARREGSPAEFLVVGGGYTGFEAASQLALRTSLRTGRPLGQTGDVARIRILELTDTVLRNVAPDLRDASRRLLEQFGVEICTETTVDEFAGGLDDSVRLSDGSEVGRALVVWTPGVAPGPVIDRLDPERTRGGRIRVDSTLRVPGRSRLLAAGDVAGPCPPGRDEPIRLSIQFALAGGRQAAHNALRLLEEAEPEPFAPRDPGYVVPLTPGKGAGSILGVHLTGRAPNLLHYFMCMFRSWSHEQRWAIPRDLWSTRRRVSREETSAT